MSLNAGTHVYAALDAVTPIFSHHQLFNPLHITQHHYSLSNALQGSDFFCVLRGTVLLFGAKELDSARPDCTLSVGQVMW
jgi:hypothetical protein